MSKEVAVCKVEDLRPGEGKYFPVGDREIALFLLGGRKVLAIDNVCPHMGGNLAAGQVHNGVVTCPLHRWTFDLASGRCPEAPEVAVDTFAVDVRDGTVYVTIEESN